MAVKTRYVVTASMIVVQVPGAQGGETYLRKGRPLPASVETAEAKRLLALGLVAREDVEVVDAPPADPPADPPAGPVKPAANAGADKWAAYATAKGLAVPDGSDKAAVVALVEAAEAAK